MDGQPSQICGPPLSGKLTHRSRVTTEFCSILWSHTTFAALFGRSEDPKPDGRFSEPRLETAKWKSEGQTTPPGTEREPRWRLLKMASRAIAVASTRASSPATPVGRRVNPRGGAAVKGDATSSGRSSIRRRRPEVSVAAGDSPSGTSTAARYDEIIADLRGAAESSTLDAIVDEVRLELTTDFYEHAVSKIDACRSAGDEAGADALDELCGRVMMASDRTFGALMPSLGDGSGDGEELDGDAAEALALAGDLTPAQQEQLQRRWDGISARLAEEGEANAIAQVEKNATSRKDSVVAILGRVPMGPKELRSLNMVTAERRIIDVLLMFPRGSERSDALTDALTPPEETDDGNEEVADGRGDNLELTDDEMLVGDEEEVFTTPARLLAAVELAIKEAPTGGDDAATVDELRSVRGEVAQRCDFLN